MASAPQNLPLFYNDLVPISSVDHATWKGRPMDDLSMFKSTHAIPITVDEFIVAQRHHPIVFTVGDEPLPIALFGLNEGINLFIDENNMATPDSYLPAYARRYPFMLVRLRQDSDDLSLCFDPTSGLLGDFEDGTPLFENGEPTEPTKGTMGFCEQFEMGAQRTTAFMAEIKEMGLLVDGETTINQPGFEQPFVYRGFQVIDEEKVKNLRGDQLRKMTQSGMLPLIHAHHFSLQMMGLLFQKQFDRGLVQINPDAQQA